jgi:hypothetical protein
MQSRIQGTLPAGLELAQLLQLTPASPLVVEELSCSKSTSAYRLRGGHVARLLHNRQLLPDSTTIYSIQDRVRNPHIEEPIYAYSDGTANLLITRHRDLRCPDQIDEAYISKLLPVLLFMDMRGVLHNDLGKQNVPLDEFGHPFVIDFDKSRCFDWSALAIEPEVLSSYFEASSSTIRTEAFNIDLFQNLTLGDQLISDDIDKNDQPRALHLFDHFINESIPYFESIREFFISTNVAPQYRSAIEYRLRKLEALTTNPSASVRLYKKKMDDNLYVAHRWCLDQVEQGRDELQPYLAQSAARLKTWRARNE